jgi:M6 family metalloprotease-like protein
MKVRSLIVVFLLLALSTVSLADHFEFMPHSLKQPDGSVINCFVSGDEFFNRAHDKDGFTIIQAPDGWYYYAIQDGDLLKASRYKVNSVDPVSVGLQKGVKISSAEYQRRKGNAENYKLVKGGPELAPQTGTLNNIVVYIRFSDDTEFSTTRQSFDNKFNLSTGPSLKSYFSEVSYNNLTISSTHYPASAMTSNLSYQDSHTRNYFQPYNATTNTSGYSTDSERTSREHKLLVEAITWLNSAGQIPSSLVVDADNDGKVDNVCFIVKGSTGDWAELLWSHSWSLYSQTVSINGKRVYNYTFQPETQASVRTLCHEMFHCIGAPDLYHYTDQGVISPAGVWDLMDGGSGHMLAYMKWKYSKNKWITSIPLIEVSGTYTLNPLTSPTNNCYKIASPYSVNEFFVVEYRSKSGTYESNLTGSGLIVYRIDTRVSGNADGPPDEVYVYRPSGTLTVNGVPGSAYFSSTIGRIAINDLTDPKSFLQDGNSGGLDISNITEAGQTISFTYKVTVPEPPGIPGSPYATGISQNYFTAHWNSAPNSLGYKIDVSTDPDFTTFVSGFNNKLIGNVTSAVVSGLSAKSNYYFRIKGVNSSGEGISSDTVHVKTFSFPPSSPPDLKAVSCNDLVTLKWRKSSGPDFERYRIYTLSQQGTMVKIDSTSGGISDTSKTFRGLTRGSLHYYRISAINNDGSESGYSILASATVKTGVIPRIKSKWNDVIICYNIGDSIKNYQWFKGEVSIPGATFQYYKTNKTPGFYSVQVSDIDGCVNASKYLNMPVSGQSDATGSIIMYPNPASLNLTVKISGEREGSVRIEILNYLSIKVSESIGVKSGPELTWEIPVSSLAKGIYYVRITIDNEEFFTDQVIISR